MCAKLIFLLLYIVACSASRGFYERRFLYGSSRPDHSIGNWGLHGSDGLGEYLFDGSIDQGPANSIRPPAWDSPIDSRPWRPLGDEYGQSLLYLDSPRRTQGLRESFNRLQLDRLTRRLNWITLGLQAAYRLQRRPRTIGNNILGTSLNGLHGSLQNTLGGSSNPLWSLFQRVPLLQNQLLRPVFNRGGFDSDDTSDASSNSEENDSGFFENSSEDENTLPANEISNTSPSLNEDTSSEASSKVEDAKVEAGDGPKSKDGEVKPTPGAIDREAPQTTLPKLI